MDLIVITVVFVLCFNYKEKLMCLIKIKKDRMFHIIISDK